MLWIELEIARDERAMRREILALENVQQAPAFHGVLTGHGRRSGGGFAGSGDGKSFRNVQPERRGIAVGGKIRKREPPCREEQVSAIFVDERGAHAGDRAVLLVYEQSRIRVGQGDVSGGGHGCGQLNDDDERILIVALESERLAVGPFYFFDDQIGV